MKIRKNIMKAGAVCPIRGDSTREPNSGKQPS